MVVMNVSLKSLSKFFHEVEFEPLNELVFNQISEISASSNLNPLLINSLEPSLTLLSYKVLMQARALNEDFRNKDKLCRPISGQDTRHKTQDTLNLVPFFTFSARNYQ
jgi:hypothetical protein